MGRKRKREFYGRSHQTETSKSDPKTKGNNKSRLRAQQDELKKQIKHQACPIKKRSLLQRLEYTDTSLRELSDQKGLRSRQSPKTSSEAAAKSRQVSSSFAKRYNIITQNKNDELSLHKCPKCRIHRVVHLERSYIVCPTCGELQRYASHVRTKVNQQAYIHMVKHKVGKKSQKNIQRYLTQYLTTATHFKVRLISYIVERYHEIHYRYPCRVNTSVTEVFLSEAPSMFSHQKWHSERLASYLRGDCSPAFTIQEVTRILEKCRLLSKARSKLSSPDQIKTCLIQNMLPQIIRSCGLDQARLLPNAKTNKIHLERCQTLAKLFRCASEEANGAAFSWTMKPFC